MRRQLLFVYFLQYSLNHVLRQLDMTDKNNDAPITPTMFVMNVNDNNVPNNICSFCNGFLKTTHKRHIMLNLMSMLVNGKELQ